MKAEWHSEPMPDFALEMVKGIEGLHWHTDEAHSSPVALSVKRQQVAQFVVHLFFTGDGGGDLEAH
jgi:hypothetical protein